MPWLYLLTAGLLEIGFASTLKLTERFTRFWPSVIFFAFCFGSFFFLERATEKIPIGTAYAVWTGIGAAGTVLVGTLVFKDPLPLGRACFLVTLIGSIIGLKLTAAH
jgi:quaternary ammonium compound-resistance protein SugE